MIHGLRDLAVAYEAWDGAVTFYMLPFTNLEYEIYATELQRLSPREKWTNPETGEEVYTDPHGEPFDDPIFEKRRQEDIKKSKWQHTLLWSNAHSFFLACVPLTVDIEFKGKKLPLAPRGIQTYWASHNGNVAHNWELFRQTIGLEAASTWLDAQINTRDDSMDGPDAIQSDPDGDTDPNV